MNFQFILSFLVTIIVIPDRVLGQQYCYTTDNSSRPQTRHFSTLTIYDRAKGGDIKYRQYFEHADCKPQKIWVLARHGIRLPAVETIQRFPELESLRQRILENINRKTTELCIEDQYSFKTWKLNKTITEENALLLTNPGRQGLERMGSMYRTKILSNILQNDLSPEHFRLGYTSTERAKSSVLAFAEGMFGKNQSIPMPQQYDKLLKGYETCDHYENIFKNIEAPGSEADKFKNSDIMKQTIKKVSDKLGFKGGLEFSEVRLIWDMCRYEEAWHSEIASAWCAAFTAENVDVFEYFEDLIFYYQNGYGNEKSSTVACHALKDMIENLKDTNTDPRAIFYFGHSNIMQLMLSAMGYKKDKVKLTSENYFDMKNRQWKSSEMTPFTANFAAVRYTCHNNEQKVMFFLNQIPVTDLSWCSVDLCRWDDVLINYDNFLNHNCDDYFCYGSSSSTIKLSLSLILISCIYFVTLYF